MSEFCTELMHWLDGGRSPWHTVAMAEQALTAQGFTPLELGAPFAVKRGGRYFVSSGTFLAAITVGARDVFRIAASHTDWPCMRIKPQPELVSGGCCRLSVEPYGGAILNTWLDRPLGLAGVALVRTDDPMRPARRLVAWDEPLGEQGRSHEAERRHAAAVPHGAGRMGEKGLSRGQAGRAPRCSGGGHSVL